MIQKAILFLTFIVSFQQLESQTYFNKALPFIDGLPNTQKLIITEDEYIIPIINYWGDKRVSSIFRTNKDFSEEVITKFEGYSYARKSPFKINENYYSICRNNNSTTAQTFIKLDNNFDTLLTIDHFRISPYGGINTSLVFQKHLYGIGVDKWNNHGELNIMKFDTLGNQLWYKNYNKEDTYTYGWQMIPSFDNNLLLANAVFYNGHSSRRHQVLKLDIDGNIIWQVDGMEDFRSGSHPVWITQLSDSSIVVNYRIESELLGFFESLNRLHWYDKDGESIRKTLIKNVYIGDVGNKKSVLNFSGIKSGKGDYFYTYGTYNAWGNQPDRTYGIIMKFNNQGDTLWTHNYLQVDHQEKLHHLEDIIELENGDIVCMGTIIWPGQVPYIWLFKLNSQGCLGDDNCGDVVITATEDISLPSNNNIMLTPNPSNGIFSYQQKWKEKIDQIIIYDMNGRLIKTITDITSDYIDLSNQENGIYNVQFVLKNKQVVVTKLVKL